MTLSPAPDQPAGVHVLRARGEVDVLTTRTAMVDLPALVRPGLPLVVDLSEVTFFDSSGLRLLDALVRECAVHGDALRVVAPRGGRARRVLDLVGMSDGLAFEDLDAALEAVRTP